MIQHEDYTVTELGLDLDKLTSLWEGISRFPTLFSDMTKGDMSNFLRFITEPGSMWLEIHKGDKSIGIVCFTNMHKVIDTDAHIIFFDRELADKVTLCKKIVEWVFGLFPLQRISVEVPTFYYATVRLVKSIGFKIEGEKRNAVLIRNRWANVYQLGITRADAEALCRS